MKIRVERKWEDAWIGVFWKRQPDRCDIWICIVPCFPIHITTEATNDR
jgi:hypothetical protein